MKAAGCGLNTHVLHTSRSCSVDVAPLPTLSCAAGILQTVSTFDRGVQVSIEISPEASVEAPDRETEGGLTVSSYALFAPTRGLSCFSSPQELDASLPLRCFLIGSSYTKEGPIRQGHQSPPACSRTRRHTYRRGPPGSGEAHDHP